ELQDKVEITVIATGFDAAYFAKRTGVGSAVSDEDEDEESPLSASLGEVEGEVETINMDEDTPSTLNDESQSESSTPFHKEDDVPSSNIWASDDDEKTEESEQDVPAFLRRFRRKKSSDDSEKEE